VKHGKCKVTKEGTRVERAEDTTHNIFPSVIVRGIGEMLMSTLLQYINTSISKANIAKSTSVRSTFYVCVSQTTEELIKQLYTIIFRGRSADFPSGFA